MSKITLSAAHFAKRKDKPSFVLRMDIFGSFLQMTMHAEDYYDFSLRYPDNADRILIDGMYAGDWYSVYESDVLPMRHNDFLDRLRLGGDIFARWIDDAHSRKKQCFLVDRVSEVAMDTDCNPIPAYTERPDWFIPAFGFQMLNFSNPEVREHKRKILAEVMRKYDFDGLDIDFERHTPILPPNRQWELREHVTEYMRMLRRELQQIAREQNRVILLSARVPDCLDGCHQDGLDVEQWIKEDLVDCLTLGSRSFDVKVEEFRAVSSEIQLYGSYDPHHTVDGYTFPDVTTFRGVMYSHLQRGADGVEYFNWNGEGQNELVQTYLEKYGLDRVRDGYVSLSKDDFTGLHDRSFLEKQDKTYVIDRKGGYPWGIGYGNLNATRQLPLDITENGKVQLYVAEAVSTAKNATMRLVFEELPSSPTIAVNGVVVSAICAPHRDLQITTENPAPTSGYKISQRLMNGVDKSKPCTLCLADAKNLPWQVGYNEITITTEKPVRLEKVELKIERK